MGVFYEFDEVDAFTVGTVGKPGQRIFLLQARVGRQRVTVKCEKQQAAAISQYLRKVLIDLPSPSDRPIADAMELTDPGDPVFTLGPIGLGYDRDQDRLLVQLEEVVDVDESGEPVDDDASERGHIRVFLSRSQALAFCDHSESVIAAGRPTCMWCTDPMNPDGHACRRMN